MALFGSNPFTAFVKDSWSTVQGGLQMVGQETGVNKSLTDIRKKIVPNDNSPQMADNQKAQDKLLADQKAAQDFQDRTKLAGSVYGQALGGQNIQSTTNKSGKKSILGSF